MTPEQRALRGNRARLFMDQAEVKEALAEIEADITAEWKAARFAWRREAKWNELKGLERLKNRLNSYANQAPR